MSPLQVEAETFSAKLVSRSVLLSLAGSWGSSFFSVLSSTFPSELFASIVFLGWGRRWAGIERPLHVVGERRFAVDVQIWGIYSSSPNPRPFHFPPRIALNIIHVYTYRIFRTRRPSGRRRFEVACRREPLLPQEPRGLYFSWLSLWRLSSFVSARNVCILWICILIACLGYGRYGKGLNTLLHVGEERLQGVEVSLRYFKPLLSRPFSFHSRSHHGNRKYWYLSHL